MDLKLEVIFPDGKRKIDAHIENDFSYCPNRPDDYMIVPDDIDGWEFRECTSGEWHAIKDETLITNTGKSLDFEHYRNENGEFVSDLAVLSPVISASETEQSVAMVNYLLWSMSSYIPEYIDIITEIENLAKNYLEKK